jgi:NAD(P)H-hydrate epimerase
MIVCGKGNNGGDGFVIARHLDIHGWPVHRLFVFCAHDELTGDAATNMRIADRSGFRPGLLGNVDVRALDSYLAESVTFHDGWIVDALFGTGLTGPIREPYERVVAAMNASAAKVLAVDIPSGLDCDTGKPLGPTVRADHTVTFVAPKAGFANPESREWTGEVHVVGIGAPRVLLKQFGVKSPSR